MAVLALSETDRSCFARADYARRKDSTKQFTDVKTAQSPRFRTIMDIPIE